MEEWTEAEVEAQLSPKKQKPVKIQKKENSGEDKGQKISKQFLVFSILSKQEQTAFPKSVLVSL